MINKIIKFKNIQKTKILNGLFKSKNFYGEFLTKTKKKNFYFIYGYRYNFSIINLVQTNILIQKSLFLINFFLKKKKNILIIGDHFEIQFLLERDEIKKNKNIILYDNFWINGLLTNKTISNYLKRNNIKLIILLKSETNENELLTEFHNVNIPVITLNNTNIDLNYINYPIFCNTKNLKSLFFLIYLIKKTTISKLKIK
jgi:ribosomal protein S2